MEHWRGLFRLLSEHPIGRRSKFRTLLRLVGWQVRSRLSPVSHEIRFVAGTKLLVRGGMTGATGNVYVGLHEFEHMAFVLHVLRRDDLFVDVGANVGSYTVLAAGAAGANCVALEPVSSSFDALMANLRVNEIEGRVNPIQAAAGARHGYVTVTTGSGAMNRVVMDRQEGHGLATVPMVTLDSIVADGTPLLLKIDVEGWETEVIRGAHSVLSHSPLGVIMELNGSGRLHGFDEGALHNEMLGYGFDTAVYDPFTRTLTTTGGARNYSGNTLYVSSVDGFRERILSAPRFEVLGISI